MDTNLDVPGIIKRAKQALNLKRDSELAEFLGVSRATVTNWAARNSIDFPPAARQIRKYGRLQLAIVGKKATRNTSRDFAKANWHKGRCR